MKCGLLRIVLVLAVFGSSIVRAQMAAQSPDPGIQSTQAAILSSQGQASLQSYIRDAWQTLTRSLSDCHSLVGDSKVAAQQRVMYVPFDFEITPEVQRIQSSCGIDVERLPKVITHLGELVPSEIKKPGLLYLPNPYVVPGGRFNEMYGWDSYFIIRGLLLDRRNDLVRGMIENFFFEIEHYGGFLNANRTYYLTRSQPPFLTSMIMSYYDAQKANGQEDSKWLAKAYGYAQRDYSLWTSASKRAGDTGLARYYDFGEGPVPEMGDDPSYYAQVGSYMLLHPDSGYRFVQVSEPGHKTSSSDPNFNLEVCGEIAKAASSPAKPCADKQEFVLSEDYYKGDRAVRESGFDFSFRFGPFSGATHHFAPICLNSLLYKAETDMEKMASILGKPEDARQWHERARIRQAAINQYLWNSQTGMFFDYDFERHLLSSYNYATTFYPLWTGVATPAQAQAVARNIGTFERSGGIAMSDRVTGVQWDLPYGWAPLQLITAEGLRRYGFNDAADRISRKFISMVLENFQNDRTIREKYNVVTRSTEAQVSAGYKANVVGFGWTNGVTSAFIHAINKEQGEPTIIRH